MDPDDTRQRKAASTDQVIVEPPTNRKRALNGGWGWMCVLGCTFMHFLIGGYGRSYGLIYLQLRRHFNSSAALTAGVGGACVAVRMGCSPLSNALSRRFSARRVVFVGGLMLGTGCVLNAFATSTEYMIFSYTLMAGFGGSLVYSPALVLVAEYFEKRRGIAVGLATAGSGVGAFVMPPIMIFLFERYGFFSGLLVVGAMMYNCCVSGALYRPLEDNYPHPVAPQNRKLPCVRLEEESAHGGGGNAEASDRNERDEATKDGAPLTGPTPEWSIRNEARDCRRNRLSRVRRAVGTVSRSMDFSIWKNKFFLLFASSQALTVMSVIPVSMLAPAVGEQNGLTEKQAAFVLSALASGDVIGRLFSGFFFDLPVLRRRRYRPYSASLMFMANTVLVWPFIASFMAVVFNAVIFGFFTGTVTAQRTSMLCDLLGVDRLSSTLGMLVAAQGVGVLFGPFFAGWCRDYFGDYKVSFLFIGVSLVVASVLSYIVGACVARKKKTNGPSSQTM